MGKKNPANQVIGDNFFSNIAIDKKNSNTAIPTAELNIINFA